MSSDSEYVPSSDDEPLMPRNRLVQRKRKRITKQQAGKKRKQPAKNVAAELQHEFDKEQKRQLQKQADTLRQQQDQFIARQDKITADLEEVHVLVKQRMAEIEEYRERLEQEKRQREVVEKKYADALDEFGKTKLALVDARDRAAQMERDLVRAQKKVHALEEQDEKHRKIIEELRNRCLRLRDDCSRGLCKKVFI